MVWVVEAQKGHTRKILGKALMRLHRQLACRSDPISRGFERLGEGHVGFLNCIDWVRRAAYSFVVGVVGVVIWIALAEFDRNFLHLSDWMFGLIPPREAFEPLKELKGDPTWMWQFIAIRFFGLVIVVPITEEFFVRGFLMRYVEDPDWDELPLGTTQKPWIWAIPTAYGVFAHMTEPLSALVWFSMVTWLYKRTGSIWDCVIAHSITNLLLGIYIFKFDAWYLW